MTTAHRPTFQSAQGSSDQGGNRMIVPTRQFSARDLPGQLSMKERVPLVPANPRELEAKLKEQEEKHFSTKSNYTRPSIQNDSENFEPSVSKILKTDSTTNNLMSTHQESTSSYVNPFPQDKDENFDDSDNGKQSKKSGSSDDSDNEEDETAKLFQEYERIKNEKKRGTKTKKSRERRRIKQRS